MPCNTLDENAKKFDVLILTIELGMICKKFDSSRVIENVQDISDKSYRKKGHGLFARKIPRCRGKNIYCDDKFLVSFTLCVTITLREEGAYG